ncbi:MAG: hypothetical protein Q9223_005711 [Gallowayella weberi]
MMLSQPNTASRRVLVLFISALGVLALLSVFFRSAPQRGHFPPGDPLNNLNININSEVLKDEDIAAGDPLNNLNINLEVLKGEAIAGKIANETTKAELGRSAWRLLHTTMSSYPLHPTASEQSALSSYVHLFARLYPCGQCASHFQQILKKFPPQVSGRKAAELWGCTVHNEVNKSLGKDRFDCARVGEVYDCGCGEEDNTDKEKESNKLGDIRVEEERMG